MMFKAVLALILTGTLQAAEDCSKLTLIHDTTIYTATVDPDSTQPATAEAMVFDGCGRIVELGNNSTLVEKYPDADDHPMAGMTVVPGFIDAHAHILGLGQSLITADLMETRSVAEIIERLETFSQTVPEDSWIIGRGWDQNDWPEKSFPDRKVLDEAFPDRPVWLRRVDGHAAWGNSAAMKATDRNFDGEWQLEGGQIIRDSEGRATGVFIDQAMSLVDQSVPPWDEATYRRALDLSLNKIVSVGLTGVHDAGTPLPVYHLFKSYSSDGRLPIRIYAMANGATEMLEYLCRNGHQLTPDNRLSARSVKFYMDGALGSRGAALLAEYSDDPGNTGLLMSQPAEFDRLVRKAATCNLQVNTHAIGDRGNRVVLDAYEAAFGDKVSAGRHRIEHAQVVELGDIKRFAQSGLIASVQPTHATSDMYWAEDRVGPDRIRGAYAWQRFLDAGVRLALGSDFPVEKPDPLIGFHAAVTRQDARQWPDRGWYPDQSLTRLQALRGFTIDAAHAAFMEEITGSLEIGKQADFVVLSADVMTISADRILKTEVLQTWTGGERVYLHPEIH